MIQRIMPVARRAFGKKHPEAGSSPEWVDYQASETARIEAKMRQFSGDERRLEVARRIVPLTGRLFIAPGSSPGSRDRDIVERARGTIDAIAETNRGRLLGDLALVHVNASESPDKPYQLYVFNSALRRQANKKGISLLEPPVYVSANVQLPMVRLPEDDSLACWVDDVKTGFDENAQGIGVEVEGWQPYMTLLIVDPVTHSGILRANGHTNEYNGTRSGGLNLDVGVNNKLLEFRTFMPDGAARFSLLKDVVSRPS